MVRRRGVADALTGWNRVGFFFVPRSYTVVSGVMGVDS